VAAAPLLIVDAPALLYRAYFALPDTIRAPDGAAVNALLGTLNYLLREVDERAPRAVVVCLGQESASYRTQLYPDYHRARPPMPDDLRGQFHAAPGLFRAFGWHLADHEALEADDLLAAHAEAEAAAGGHALLLTGDRDLFQCASERATVLLVRTGRDGPDEFGPREVRRHYGVDPSQVPDFIALRGDPSDGLPGAPGIGAKTAADLLQRHGSLENVLAATYRERPRVGAALREAEARLRVFKDIATLRPPAVERVADAPTDRGGGAAAARQLGMSRLARRLEGAVAAA
jgi:5'-3' exonuclease